MEPEDTRKKIDIDKLNAEIDEIVRKEEELRASINAIIADFSNGGDEHPAGDVQ